MRRFLLSVAFVVLGSTLVAQQALNNDGVLKLLKAGLSEELVVSTINASPAAYDTSANGIVALKTAGASDKVIAAILLRASGVAVPAANAPATTSTLPPGIDSVGVYYKDKSGGWTSMLPEVINFKTGGVLKGIASYGMVKPDTNGHVPGAHAKLSATFPVVFAVYVPEGTEITEYQLLRLRENKDNREFRSVTGGVFHSSGGASRDVATFTPVKIAPRVFQITLDSALGKGEYGLLPPGAYGSSNMASGGKMYTVSIIE